MIDTRLQSRTVLLIWWGWRGGASSSFSFLMSWAERETRTAIMKTCKSLDWSLHHGCDEEGKRKEVHAPSSFISLPHSAIWFNISTERNSSLKILLLLPPFSQHPYTSPLLFCESRTASVPNILFRSCIKSDKKYKIINLCIKTVKLPKVKHFHI